MGFDGIDINMGCPVSKIIRQGHCSGLIEDKPLAKELVLAAIEGAGAVPVSVKTRLGFRQLETEEWAGHLLELPIAALTIHGRTAKQLSQGPANWEEIGKVVALRNAMRKDTLVIGNGDVLSLAEAQQKHQEYGVDGVMIGRGVFQNPFVFGGGPVSDIRELSTAGKLDLLLAHARAFCARWGSGRRIGVLKKFFKIYVRDFSGASDLRTQLMEAQSLAELESVIQRFLGQSAESSSDVSPPRPLA